VSEAIPGSACDFAVHRLPRSDALGNESTKAVLALNTLEIGGNSFSNVEAAEYAGEVPVDGSIGRAFLNQFLTVYDYSSRKITLFAQGERSGADTQHSQF
jgi:hypothetical protein